MTARMFGLVVLLFVLHQGASSALAHTLVYEANMDGPSESPPNASPGTGFTRVTIDDHAFTMRVEASFSGLLGTTTAAHIHAPTTEPGQGIAGVATQLPSFSGFPLGVTSGLMDQTFDMTNESSWNSAFISANGGNTAGAFSALLTALDQQKAYFNIHTSVVGGGEIRGFYTLVPEPSGLALLLAGGAAALRRRRCQAR